MNQSEHNLSFDVPDGLEQEFLNQLKDSLRDIGLDPDTAVNLRQQLTRVAHEQLHRRKADIVNTFTESPDCFDETVRVLSEIEACLVAMGLSVPPHMSPADFNERIDSLIRTGMSTGDAFMEVVIEGYRYEHSTPAAQHHIPI